MSNFIKGDVIRYSNIELKKTISKYVGKVRDVYKLENDIMVSFTTDRISAFDIVLDAGIPHKGAVLNTIAYNSLEQTSSIVRNWTIDKPHPMVTIGLICKPIRVEMIVRGYLVGHAWREYKKGKRKICDKTLKNGLKENSKFDEPIVTPSYKSDKKDEDITRQEIIDKGLCSSDLYDELHEISLKLFEKGTEYAESKGLILADTKYEFGLYRNEIVLIDEVHTPDSSRYFYKKNYLENLKNNKPQEHLSKEFLREWLMENNILKNSKSAPKLSNQIINKVSNRYIELYEILYGNFNTNYTYKIGEIEKMIEKSLSKIY